MNAWLNIYKPKGISSAKTVSIIKRLFKGDKIGHAGTLDLEAEGVLPIAVGEATKLICFLINAKKTYIFTIKFGAKTDTADSSGKIISICKHLSSKQECVNICRKFVGEITQVPPAYSALKINGVRAYKLARENKEVNIVPRTVTIYNLQCINYNAVENSATFITECSKGTYIRTLAEDISLSLQSLGFVIELCRTKVGIFAKEEAINASNLVQLNEEEALKLLKAKCLKIEGVLDDIPVLDVDETIAKRIMLGQKVRFEEEQDSNLIWIRNNQRIIAIGSLHGKGFKSSRVFNYNKINGETDVYYS